MLVTITVKAIQLATILSPNSSIPLERRTRLSKAKQQKASDIESASCGGEIGHMFARVRRTAIPMGILIKNIQLPSSPGDQHAAKTGPELAPPDPAWRQNSILEEVHYEDKRAGVRPAATGIIIAPPIPE